MRTTAILTFIFLTAIIPDMKAQKNSTREKLYIPNIDSCFEKFDTIRYQRIRYEGEKYGSETLPDETIVFLEQHSTVRFYTEIPPNSYFSIGKTYYSNGNIESKGIELNYRGLKQGVWYYFNEDGSLKESIDYDKPYKSTFADILAFCRKEGIDVKIGHIVFNPNNPHFSRKYMPEEGKYIWKIFYRIPLSIKAETIIIDDVTGKVLYRYRYNYRHPDGEIEMLDY